MTAERDDVARRVRAFYEQMPFSAWSSPARAAEALRANAIASSFPDLHRLLASGKVRSVLDLGCGAGWLVHTVALHYGLPAAGVDFAAAAIARARATADALGLGRLARFETGDLFAGGERERADLVTSVGVLHHTHDARAGSARAAALVAGGGHLFVGLYHRHGREPVLRLLRDVLERDGEEAALRRYAALDGARRGDDAHLRSWFRDQVLHPHETSHTLAEVASWLEEDGFALRSTSVNGFEPIGRTEDLFAAETALGEVSRRVNCVEGRFYPGFFTVLAQRVRGR